MADVIAGQKIVGRPIRLKNGRIEASLGQFVFVRVNHIRVGMVLNPFYVLKKRIRLEEVIVIEESHPVTPCQRQAPI